MREQLGYTEAEDFIPGSLELLFQLVNGAFRFVLFQQFLDVSFDIGLLVRPSVLVLFEL